MLPLEGMTTVEFITELRKLGKRTDYYTVRQEIIDGLYPFARAVKKKYWRFDINRMGFEQWRAEKICQAIRVEQTLQPTNNSPA